MDFEIKLELTKNDNDSIDGVKLSAKPHTESIDFCATFPKALFTDGTADIAFEENKIIFKHPKCDFPGECEFELSPDEIMELREVINPKNTISLEQWQSWGGGFRLYVKNL